MNSLFRFLFIISLGILLFNACTDDDMAAEAEVVTEDVVGSSGERAILTGRVLSTVEVNLTDHGFHVSESEDFANAQNISLGARTLPGRFVGEIEGLDIGTEYFCRAYIELGGNLKTGNPISFDTRSPMAFDFLPKFGTTGTTIIIEGSNFTDDSKVLWDGETIIPDEVAFESFITFKAPAIVDNIFPEMKVVSQGLEVPLSEPFEYIVGEWNEIQQLTSVSPKKLHVYFKVGDELVEGMGHTTGSFSLMDIFKVTNVNTLDTTIINFPGSPTEGAFFADGYFGGGSVNRLKVQDPFTFPTTEFWKYEDQGFVQLADIPFGMYRGAALRVDQSIYVYGGEDSDRIDSRRAFRYDIDSDNWTELQLAPVSPKNAYPAYHLDGYNYFIAADSTIFKHNIATDFWEEAGVFPNEVKPYGITLNVNDTYYIGMQENSRKLWELDTENNRWIPKRSNQEINPYFTISGYAHNDRLYVIRGRQPSGEERLIWELDPNGF